MSESTSLRQAHRRDIPRLAELWAHAFPGERTVDERIRQLEAGGIYGGIGDAWYLEQDGALAGAFRGYPLHQYLHGARLPMLGVAAVAVASHARRRGVGGALCRGALRVGRERGDVISVLFPFRPSFYYRLGWGLVGELHVHRFRTQSLPAPAVAPAVRLAGRDDLAGVHACYAAAARASHGLLERTPRIWGNHLAMPHRHVFVRVAGGRVDGYILASYGRAAVPEERTLLVHELVALDDAARDELLGWLALQCDEWPQTEYHALPEERFDLLLEDPRPPRHRAARNLWAPVGQRIRGPMLRILDLPAALHAREQWPQGEPFAFSLRVRDPELPANEGPWRVDFDGARVSCTPLRAGEPEVELTAPELAQLYAGELGVGGAVHLGRARCTADARRIDALFGSARTLRLLDEF